MADVYLYQGFDGGEISVKNGVIQMTDSLETAVYISLFGQDKGDYWGNLLSSNEQKINSQTAKLLVSLPSTMSNLNKLEEAIQSDLGWIKSLDYAKEIYVKLMIPGINAIGIYINIDGIDLVFVSSWGIDEQKEISQDLYIDWARRVYECCKLGFK